MLGSAFLVKGFYLHYKFWLGDAIALEILVHASGAFYTYITLSFKINLRDITYIWLLGKLDHGSWAGRREGSNSSFLTSLLSSNYTLVRV